MPRPVRVTDSGQRSVSFWSLQFSGNTAPTFFLLKKGSMVFRRKDLNPVVVSESLACKLAVPLRSICSSRNPYFPFRWTMTLGTLNERFSSVRIAFFKGEARESSMRSIRRGCHRFLHCPGHSIRSPSVERRLWKSEPEPQRTVDRGVACP